MVVDDETAAAAVAVVAETVLVLGNEVVRLILGGRSKSITLRRDSEDLFLPSSVAVAVLS